MYERFTDRARLVMRLAHEEAQHFKHEYIGTEHVLLGLIRETSGIAARAMRNLGVDEAGIRREVENAVLKGSMASCSGNLPLTPRVKKALEYAVEEARALRSEAVGPEHLLLALLARAASGRLPDPPQPGAQAGHGAERSAEHPRRLGHHHATNSATAGGGAPGGRARPDRTGPARPTRPGRGPGSGDRAAGAAAWPADPLPSGAGRPSRHRQVGHRPRPGPGAGWEPALGLSVLPAGRTGPGRTAGRARTGQGGCRTWQRPARIQPGPEHDPVHRRPAAFPPSRIASPCPGGPRSAPQQPGNRADPVRQHDHARAAAALAGERPSPGPEAETGRDSRCSSRQGANRRGPARPRAIPWKFTTGPRFPMPS